VGRLGKEDLLSYTVENQNDRQGQERRSFTLMPSKDAILHESEQESEQTSQEIAQMLEEFLVPLLIV